jgi:hypothetical protein
MISTGIGDASHHPIPPDKENRIGEKRGGGILFSLKEYNHNTYDAISYSCLCDHYFVE